MEWLWGTLGTHERNMGDTWGTHGAPHRVGMCVCEVRSPLGLSDGDRAGMGTELRHFRSEIALLGPLLLAQKNVMKTA